MTDPLKALMAAARRTDRLIAKDRVNEAGASVREMGIQFNRLIASRSPSKTAAGQGQKGT